MDFQIEKVQTTFGFLGQYKVTVASEEVGYIEPTYRSAQSSRASGYAVSVMAEDYAFTDDGGAPLWFRTVKEVKAALASFFADPYGFVPPAAAEAA
jgi:hypothetical protein